MDFLFNSRFIYKNPFLADKIILSGKSGSGIYLPDGTTIVDENGNIDAPITTTNLTTSGNTTLGDASSDTLTVPSTSQFNAPVSVGVNDTGYDVTFYGATAGKKFFWDESADTAYLTCTVDIDGTVTVGENDTGYDVKFFGATAGAYWLWDESADSMIIAGTAKIDIGSSGTPLVLTEGSPIFDLYSTCASTSGSTSAEPFYLKSTMTGAGGVGGRARFHLYTNVALGGWANALKAYTEFGASGRVTGLGSALCAEMALSAGTTQGTYAPLESEIVLGAGSSLGTETSFMYMAVSGANQTAMDDSGDLFKLDGLTAASGKLFQANTAGAATHALRCDIGGTKYYVMLTDTGA